MNIIDYIIIAIVLLSATFSLRLIIKTKKDGKHCGGNCADCTLRCSEGEKK